MTGEIVFYQSDDGQVRVQARLENDTLWMTQPQLAELFQTSQQNISQHIQNIFDEGELAIEATHKKNLWVRQEGQRQVQRELNCYQPRHGDFRWLPCEKLDCNTLSHLGYAATQGTHRQRFCDGR